MRFKVVVADPPWRFGDSLPGPGRGASKHYATLSLAEIDAFLPALERSGEVRLADDVALFLWRVAAIQSAGVPPAWGFTVKSELVWLKRTATGKLHFGMDRSVRMCHESAIIAHRGRPQRRSASIRSVFEARLPCDEHGRVRHSAKPDEFYALVEQLYSGPYLELFARRRRPGWTTLGNEVG
jgi:N6-adenosine-specific RNA methylase IME4